MSTIEGHHDFAVLERRLAELILDHKVDVCDVPIADVTDRFLAAARGSDGWDLEEATWFLAVCAVLLEMKVARLMPKPEELRDDDLLGSSPDLAYARSLELAAFRKVVDELWQQRQPIEEHRHPDHDDQRPADDRHELAVAD